MKNYIPLLVTAATLSTVGESKFDACGLDDYELLFLGF